MIGNFRLELASKKISAAASESESKGGDLIYLPFDKPHSVPKHLGNDSLRHALDPIASPFSRRALFRTKTEKVRFK